MAGPFFRLFLAVLCFSHIAICLHAVPITRSRSLVLDISQEHKVVLEKTPMINTKDILEEDETVRRLLAEAAEINDYPGSGANNRHTPRPQLGRGCVEC